MIETVASNKHMIINKIMQLRQLFLQVTFLSVIEIVSAVFNISSSHSATNLSIKLPLYLQFS